MFSRGLMAVAALALVLAACSSDSSDEEGADTTSTTQATTTTAETTTTTQATTTTESATTTQATTTTAVDAVEVQASPVFATLQPFAGNGAELFPPGSVEAHWYTWDGLWVVLYRGFDASDGSPICAGNSGQENAGFNYITNSPHNGDADDICAGAPKIAEPPQGVYSCGSLLYYLTEIPTDAVANLYGTLEIATDDGFDSQTSAVAFDAVDGAPEFEPGLTAYSLPPTAVDDGGVVTCG